MKAMIVVAGLMTGLVAQSKNIVLTESNSVVFRGVVTEESVSKSQLELIRKCKGAALYLVLDTPGGSVPDGNQLIDTIKGLSCPIHTVTIFAASMGFHFAQNLDKRFITTNGTLMSHRASIGLRGEIPGEFLTRIRYFLRTLGRMDRVSATRMGLSLEKYQTLIRDEYWVSGEDAVKDKAADEVVNVTCGNDLQGNINVSVMTMFGSINVTYSKCPMITAPLGVDMGSIKKENKEALTEYFSTLFSNRVHFVEKYIKTNAYQKFQ